MKKIFSILILGLFVSNCTVKYQVVGKYEEFKEVFIGTVDSNLLTGTSVIRVETNPSKMKCEGTSKITHIPAVSFILPVCTGQRGIATLICSITGRVDAQFEAKSCSSGFGTGYDSKGRLFAFTFGLNEEQARVEIDRLMSEARNKPELPIYEPEKVRKKIGYNTGTGFFISREGHMVTNYHVIKNSKKITVSIDGKEQEAKLIASDKISDIAIIKVNNKQNSNPIPLIEANSSDVGEEVFTLGYPLVSIQGKELKATFGRINAMSGLQDDTRLMQIDVPIQPGNSGGPLINSKGQVVGIVTATLDSIVALYKSGSLPQNVNFAVKSNYVLSVIDQITLAEASGNEKKFSEWVKLYKDSVKMVIAR